MDYKLLSEKLLTDGEQSTNDELENSTRYHHPSRLRILLVFLATLLLMLGSSSVGYGLCKHINARHQAREYTTWKDCGSSASEARERGCVFDIMMTGWVKEECYDQALSEEYLKLGGFRFFYDLEGTDEMPLGVVRRGEHHHMYTNDLHHRAHCVYVWKLQALALEAQAKGEVKLISNESMSYDHTVHCAQILVNSNPSPPFSMNYGEVDYLTCGPYLS
jgi:hypothetical protein